MAAATPMKAAPTTAADAAGILAQQYRSGLRPRHSRAQRRIARGAEPRDRGASRSKRRGQDDHTQSDLQLAPFGARRSDPGGDRVRRRRGAGALAQRGGAARLHPGDATRELLLRTSILDCVSADLASELAGDAQAASTLAELAQANAFVRPLGHGWFRYHAMFAEVLRLKLRSEHPDQLPDLHQRAAWWYQRNGYLLEAVRHAQPAVTGRSPPEWSSMSSR